MAEAAATPRRAADPPFGLLVAIGGAGALVICLGLVALAYLEPAPPGGPPVPVRVAGPFTYNPAAHRLGTRPTKVFTPGQVPATEVTWSAVPSGLEVGAGWFDESGQDAGSVGPAPAGRLPALVAMDVPAGARVPPGRYEFVVGRYEGGRLVQVLFRTWIEVTPPG